MLTVKQVAAALGIDERSVRDKLLLGTLKGTKKTVGQKDQWFIHQRDLDAELARRGLSPLNQARENVTPAGAALNFSPQGAAPMAASEQRGGSTAAISDAEIVTAAVSGSFTDNVDLDPDEVIAEVTAQPDSAGKPENAQSTWRNEDLEKKMQETAEAFMKPLIERVEMLTRETLEKDRVIEEQRVQLRLLPDLESQKAKLLNEIEAERKAAEIQFAKAAEKEEQAKTLEAENESLKQKAQEAALSAAKLEQLEKEIHQLKQPKPSIWKRLFMPGGGQES